MKKLSLILSLLTLSICSFSQSRSISNVTKKIVFIRDDGSCQCCGSSESLEYDHIIPYSCGGESDASNIQLLCRHCNRSKQNSCYCKAHDKKVGYNCCKDEPRSSPSGGTSSQCTGTTKKGTRCQKMTKNSNERCNTHQ